MKSKRGKFAIKRGYAVTFETDSFYLFPSLLADFIAVYIFSVYIRDTCEATYPPLSNSRWKKGLGRNRRGRKRGKKRKEKGTRWKYHWVIAHCAPSPAVFTVFSLRQSFQQLLNRSRTGIISFREKPLLFPVAPSRSIECNNFVNYYLDQRWIEILQFCFEQSY